MGTNEKTPDRSLEWEVSPQRDRQTEHQPVGLNVQPVVQDVAQPCQNLTAINHEDAAIPNVSSDVPKTAAELLPLVYEELRSLARILLRSEAVGHTLQPTALVHEAYARLVKPGDIQEWNHSAHFYATAARVMRRILVESARRKQRWKHGGEYSRRELAEEVAVEAGDELLALDAAIAQLEKETPVIGQLVTLHHFAGLSIEDAGEILGMSRATAYREWSYARARLRVLLGDSSLS